MVLLLAVVATAAVIWLLVAQPWSVAASQDARPSSSPNQELAATDLPVPGTSSSPGASESATGSATDQGTEQTDASATPSVDAEAPVAPSPGSTAAACLARDVTVEPVTDQESYGTGQNPQLSIRLTNSGTTDCSLNVGTSGQSFTITSGSDVWWRSTDCQTESSDMVVLLAAGQSVSSSAPLVWDRTRSSVDTCAATDRQTAPGGGASYHLDVEIGGIASTESAQLLLY
jgi:hypothetical protein